MPESRTEEEITAKSDQRSRNFRVKLTQCRVRIHRIVSPSSRVLLEFYKSKFSEMSCYTLYLTRQNESWYTGKQNFSGSPCCTPVHGNTFRNSPDCDKDSFKRRERDRAPAIETSNPRHVNLVNSAIRLVTQLFCHRLCNRNSPEIHFKIFALLRLWCHISSRILHVSAVMFRHHLA